MNNSSITSNITSPTSGQSQFDMRLLVASVMGSASFLGVLGNIFVLVFFGFLDRKDLTAAKVFILAIALVDLVACCVQIPGSLALMFIGHRRPFSHRVAVNSFGTWTVYTTALLIQAMAWERYLAICRPLSFNSGVGKAVKICFVIFALSVVLSFFSVYPQDTVGVYKPGLFAKIYGGYVTYALTVLIVFVLYFLIWFKIFKPTGSIGNSVSPGYNPSTSYVPPTTSVNPTSLATDITTTRPPCEEQSKGNDLRGPSNQSSKITTTVITVNGVNENRKVEIHPEQTVMEPPCQDDKNTLQVPVPQQDGGKHPRLTRKQKPRVRMVLALFLLSVIFLVSWLPSLLSRLGLMSGLWGMLIYLNNVANPFLYAIVNVRFRSAILNVIKCRKP